nr:GAF domain-containing protein [Oculatella sp. LEGE 06141]
MQVANEALTVARDVAEQQQQHYRDLFEFAPDGYLVTDASGVIQDANVKAERLLNTKKRFLLGKPLIVYLAEGDRITFHNHLQQIGQQERLEWVAHLKPRADTVLPVAVTVVPIFNPLHAGKLRWMLRDITRQQQMEEALRQHQEELEDLVAERTAKLLTANRQLQQEIRERQQAEAALRQQTERERLLNNMTQRIRQSLQLDDILAVAVTEIRAFLNAERVAIYQRTEGSTSQFKMESTAPGIPSLQADTLHPPLEVLLADTLQAGAVVAIADVEDADLSTHCADGLIRLEVRANLSALLTVDQQPWGCLCVQQCSEARQWKPFEIDFLRQFATQLEIAVQQSSLYHQLQQFNANLSRQVQGRTAELQRLLTVEALMRRITDKVRMSLDEDQILQTVVQELPLVLGLEACDAALYNLAQRSSTICYNYPTVEGSTQGDVIQMADFAQGYHQLLTGQSFQFCDLPSGSPHGSARAAAILACPICDDRDALGDLWLLKPLDMSFDEQDVRLVEQVAAQCAIAIRQARLYQTSQVQVAELRRLDYLKNDFLNTVSHELRTPVANMQMAIQMLRVASTPERREQYLNIMQSECRREAALLNDVLDLQRLELSTSPTFLAESIRLQDLLPKLIAPFQSRTQTQQQQLHVHLAPDFPSVVVNRASLERLLTELLNNACKYTAAGGEIAIAFDYTDSPSLRSAASASVFVPVNRLQDASDTPTGKGRSVLIITVQNTAAIAARELPRIFEKFYRIPKLDPWKHGGTGLGLALVQGLVEQMQGNLQVESQNGWTTFTLQLPTSSTVRGAVEM